MVCAGVFCVVTGRGRGRGLGAWPVGAVGQVWVLGGTVLPVSSQALPVQTFVLAVQ
jgi:hypothetical protein